MFATGLFVLAATLQFNGIMGQSAVPGDPPLTFTGVRALTEGPGGRLLLTGDDGVLYALVDGEVVSLGVRVPAAHLAWDGRTLWALGSDAVWTVDEECPGCFAAHKAFDVPGLHFDQAAVRPELADHPFAGKGKFFRWDRGRNVLVAHDAAGRECGTVFTFPRRKGDSALVALGFLPGTEDLVASSYYPDVRLYRFRVDGSQVTGNGWPANRGYGLLRRFKGRLYHMGTDVLPLGENLLGARAMRVGHEAHHRGWATDGVRDYLATSQGLYVREPGETRFRTRRGGIRPLTALAVNAPYVFLSMGGTVRWLYLDEDATGVFASSDDDNLRVANAWIYPPLDMVPEGANLLVAGGEAGLYCFHPFLPPGASPRDHWEKRAPGPCPRVPGCRETFPGVEAAIAAAGAALPEGIEPGLVARQGKWLVVEDRKNFRLVRFKVLN